VTAPAALSHLDCRASLTLIVAQQSYPETPVANQGLSFICDESYIDVLERVDGAYLGDPTVVEPIMGSDGPWAQSWVALRQRAAWEGRNIRLDVHMIGPFPNGDTLVGKFGVASCGCGGAGGHDIWAKAAQLVTVITPHAVAWLHEAAPVEVGRLVESTIHHVD
jgi:hypothetical protein